MFTLATNILTKQHKTSNSSVNQHHKFFFSNKAVFIIKMYIEFGLTSSWKYLQ